MPTTSPEREILSPRRLRSSSCTRRLLPVPWIFGSRTGTGYTWARCPSSSCTPLDTPRISSPSSCRAGYSPLTPSLSAPAAGRTSSTAAPSGSTTPSITPTRAEAPPLWATRSEQSEDALRLRGGVRRVHGPREPEEAGPGRAPRGVAQSEHEVREEAKARVVLLSTTACWWCRRANLYHQSG